MSILPSKQKAILDYVEKNGQITYKVVTEMLSDFYYNNKEKRISEILGRMIKSGKLVQISNGVYQLGGEPADTTIINQTGLF